MQLPTINGKVCVNRLVLDRNEKIAVVSIGEDDLVFFQNGSMTDAPSLGSMTSPPGRLTKMDSQDRTCGKR